MFTDIFPRKKPIIGVVRLLPLPGYKEFPGVGKIIETALKDIQKLEKAGFDGALVDNHTHPHVVKSTPEMTASFTAVMQKLVKKSKIPLGVQFLIDDSEASLFIAKNSGAVFIRTDFFVDGVKTEYGIMKPKADQIVAYRKKISGEDILILADIQVKHAEMLDKKKSISVSAKQALSAGADAVIVTGSWTGIAPESVKLSMAKKITKEKPVLIGSGLSIDNSKTLLQIADGALVGTAIRDESRIDFSKAKKLMLQVKKNLNEVKMANNEKEGSKLIDLEPFLDFQEMKKFWEAKGIVQVNFGVSGHMNLTWFGLKDGKEIVCQFGPSLKFYQKTDLQERESYGYFYPEKYVKAKEICKKAKHLGIPCPEIVEAGYETSLARAWCITEKAYGENLEDHWSEMDEAGKLKVLEQFGGYLGKLHSIPVNECIVKPADWYDVWFDLIAHNLQTLGIYRPEELSVIKKVVLPTLKKNWLPPKFTLIHGDPLQKNIFVNPQKAEVTDIIDWETAGLGNPWADAVFAAWWMSGEYGGNEKEYEALINGYNQGLSDKTLLLDIETAKQMNPYLDILWYLNILWVRPFMGDNSQTKRRKGMVEKIFSSF